VPSTAVPWEFTLAILIPVAFVLVWTLTLFGRGFRAPPDEHDDDE